MACSSGVPRGLEQTEFLDVAVGDGLDPLELPLVATLEDVREAALQAEVLVDRRRSAQLGRAGDLAVLGLEQRVEPALDRQAGQLDRVGRTLAVAT
jgi:hypothetical protein